MSGKKHFHVRRAELTDRGPDADIATIGSGVLFYPRCDGETFDWPAGTTGNGELEWRPAGMPDGELITLRWQLVSALAAVEVAMEERNMFKRYTP